MKGCRLRGRHVLSHPAACDGDSHLSERSTFPSRFPVTVASTFVPTGNVVAGSSTNLMEVTQEWKLQEGSSTNLMEVTQYTRTYERTEASIVFKSYGATLNLMVRYKTSQDITNKLIIPHGSPGYSSMANYSN